MEKFFDWLNNWFDNANIRLKRYKELKSYKSILREYAIESNIGYT